MTKHKHTPPHIQTAMQELRQAFVARDINQMREVISRLTPAEGMFLGFSLGASISSDDVINGEVIGRMFARIALDNTGSTQCHKIES